MREGKRQFFKGKDKKGKKKDVAVKVNSEKIKRELEQERILVELGPKIREWLEKHFDLFIRFKTEQTKQSKTQFSIGIEKVVGRFAGEKDYDTYCEKLPDGMEAQLVAAHNEFFKITNGYPVRYAVEKICLEIVKTRQSETKHELKAEAKKKDTIVISLDQKIREKLGVTDPRQKQKTGENL